ncbi:outer membrane beta-barrel protein [Hydrogenophaga sp.]|uniref:outer membrane beta-barrel protein n=1 Tax=Hydrogenophaga sp. TaxID=1904254 RepID=UPI002ABC06A9|nr:outer membrane beta-barrel protein [Hydrogenophaga sp.]MDZ4399408.1 outer membrane beta-barrel protein [Hydrogenophaga sp.]
MFRHALMGVAVAAVTVTTLPVAAQSFTLEAAVGSSKFTDDTGGLDDTATAVGVLGRYTWANGLGVEGGLRGHGEWAVSDGVNTLRPAVTSAMLGLSYDLPVGHWSLGARVGVHAWRLRGNVISSNSQVLAIFEDSGASTYYSLGASYAVTERLSLGSYYNVFNLEDGMKIKGLDVRLSYRF